MLAPKHQIIADAKLAGMTGREAGIKAGYPATTATQNASKILARPDVRAYMAAGQKDMQDAAKLDRDAYVRMIGEKIEAAEGDDQYNAVSSLMKLLGQALGHIDAKAPMVQVNNYAGQPREERVERLISSLGEAGIFLPPPSTTPPTPAAEPYVVNHVPRLPSREADHG